METFGKNQWIDMFKEIGMTEAQMKQWHDVFEAKNPEKHQEFLEWLGIDEEDIKQVRKAHSS